MSNLIKYAEDELDIIGMKDGDDLDGAMRKHLLQMVKLFSEEGHSGFSASYAIQCLEKLLKYEPLSPLTGKDDEWIEIAEDMTIGGKLWQNKRCYRVFKDESGAYDSEGKVFWEWMNDKEGDKFKSYFTSSDSRVYITFPYVPTREYVERISDD